MCNKGNEELYMLHLVQVVLMITCNHGNQTDYLGPELPEKQLWWSYLWKFLLQKVSLTTNIYQID